MDLQRLSGEYIRGYTKAIIDIEKVLKNVQNNLVSHRKRLNFKVAMQTLKLFLENRKNFRENCDGFIRWNVQKNELEQFKDDSMWYFTEYFEEVKHNEDYSK